MSDQNASTHCRRTFHRSSKFPAGRVPCTSYRLQPANATRHTEEQLQPSTYVTYLTPCLTKLRAYCIWNDAYAFLINGFRAKINNLIRITITLKIKSQAPVEHGQRILNYLLIRQWRVHAAKRNCRSNIVSADIAIGKMTIDLSPFMIFHHADFRIVVWISLTHTAPHFQIGEGIFFIASG